ncbi:MAG: 50S ribosomal protein L9 [Oscillospiraceae bacterium]|nr:50S ribosomal protein L9 [Oscillospiraceae bacterium]
MKVVLKQDIKGTGKKDQMVEVSDGYARNFLFPRKLAVPADAANANDVKNKAEAKQFHLEQERAAAQKLADAVNEKGITIHAKAGTNGRLFGAVTAKDIAQAIKESYGVELDKRKIVLDADIKAYGCYPVSVKIYNGITAQVTVNVLE